MVGGGGFEPPISCTQNRRLTRLGHAPIWVENGGAEGARTPDPLHAMQVLSQLSYSPIMYQRQLAGTRRSPHFSLMVEVIGSGVGPALPDERSRWALSRPSRPAAAGWEPKASPFFFMVGAIGFEPTASCSRSRRATRLRHAPIIKKKYIPKQALPGGRKRSAALAPLDAPPERLTPRWGPGLAQAAPRPDHKEKPAIEGVRSRSAAQRLHRSPRSLQDHVSPP